MVANERELSLLRVAVVLFSIQIIFFLYHVALSNPGYVNPAAVIPWAVKVSGKMGECMEVAAWWLVCGLLCLNVSIHQQHVYWKSLTVKTKYKLIK